MPTDTELLRQYVEQASQEAFAELVRRHVGFVYATAVRKGRSPHRAEDITQVVFTDLARKAPKLLGRTDLVGWLYTSTQYAAAKFIRTEVRREIREKEAQVMHELTSESPSAIDWEQLHPVLDEALQELAEPDRNAILLRFFKNQSYSEIGAALRLTEEAARKRANRALDQLHAALTRRGVTSTSVALVAALQAQPVLAVPSGFAASISSAALGAASAGGLAVSAPGMLDALLNTKSVIAGATLLGVALAWVEIDRTNEVVGRFSLGSTAVFGLVRPAPGAPSVSTGAGARGAAGSQPVAGRAAAKATGEATVEAMPGIAFPTPPIPPEALRNVGLATPLDALQTVAWAQDRRDLDVLAGGLTFSTAGRPKAEVLLAALPEQVRGRIRDPEHMWAMHMLANPNPYRAAAIRVTGKTQPDPKNLSLRIGIDPVEEDALDRWTAAIFRKTVDGNWQQLVRDYDLSVFSQQPGEFAAEIAGFLDGKVPAVAPAP